MRPAIDAQAKQKQPAAQPSGVAPIQEQAAQQQQPATWDYQRTCKYPKDREEADLCQQWRSAEAAEKIVLIGGRQFWATVAEAALLALTVLFTAWAAVAAGIAARAAKVSGDLARMQLRAQLVATVPLIEPELSKQIVPKFIVKNVGLTLARHVTTFANLTVRRLDDKQPFAPPVDLLPGSTNVLAADVQMPVTFRTEDIYNEALERQIRDKVNGIFVYGFVRYTDVFGKARTTNFKHRYDWRNLRDKNAMLHTCPDGNDSD